MKNDVPLKNGIVIPGYEFEITTSRSGGAGGQHVNKTSTRITIRWNVNKTTALDEESKKRILEKLQTKLTSEGDLIVHNSASRSQQQNKKMAFMQLARELNKALYIPQERVATKVTKAAKESRLQKKTHRSAIKKMRIKKHYADD